jgi:hypothetical protein
MGGGGGGMGNMMMGGGMGGGMGETEFHLDVERILMGMDRRTTIMVRNVPNKVSELEREAGGREGGREDEGGWGVSEL